jgi:hypothetical protein
MLFKYRGCFFSTLFYFEAIVSISTKTPNGNSFTANAARAGGF